MTTSRRTTADGRQIYTLRRNGKDGFALAVPGEIGKMIPSGTQFAFELTDDGFAYSIVETTTFEDGLPNWLTRLDAGETS